MGKINTCPQHKIVAAHLCPVCHRSVCSRCPTFDGCCSKRCAQRRQKFWAPVWRAVGPRRDGSWVGLLVKLALLTGAVLGVARYLGRI